MSEDKHKLNPIGIQCSDCGADNKAESNRKSCPECRAKIGCGCEYPDDRRKCWPWQCSKCYADNHDGTENNQARTGRKHSDKANSYMSRKLAPPWWEAPLE